MSSKLALNMTQSEKPPRQDLEKATMTSVRSDNSSLNETVVNDAGDDECQQNEKQSEQGSDDKPEEVEQRKLKGFLWVIVVIAVLSSTFLYALDNTIMANVRPAIINSLGHIDMLPWISVSYPLGEVGSNPLWGTLYRQFENKKLYLACIVLFELGSVVSGSAKSMQALIVGRVLGGLGGSGIYVGTINIITGMTTIAERTQYLNFVGMAWSLGTVLGPIIGGALADSSASWRWAFYLNICIAAFAAPACIFLVPTIRPDTQHTITQRLKRVDYVGAILFFGSVVTIIMVLSFGGSLYSWSSGNMIGLYVATFVAWTLFVLQQYFRLLNPSGERIFPCQYVKDPLMVNMFSWNAIAIANIVVTIYSLALLLQFAFGYSALKSGVYTLPFIGAAVCSAGAAGPILEKYPYYMPFFAVCSAIQLIGNALLTTIDYHSSKGTICGYSVIQGIGVGAVIQLGYTVGQSKVPKHDVPRVTAFLSCAQMAGLALALGISTCVFLNQAADGIAAILPGVPRSTVQAGIEGAGAGFLQSVSPDTREMVLEVIGKNIGKIFYLNVAGSALGLVTSLFMKRERLVLA